MQRLFKAVWRPGSFVRHALTLATGNAVAQLMLVAAIPVIARLYRPADLGIQALFFGLVALLSIVSSGRYPLAIVQAANDREAVAVVKLSLVLLAGSTGLVAALAGVAGPNLLRWAGHAELVSYAWCVPVALLLTGFDQVFSNWTIRNRRFHLQSVARMSASGATVGTQIALGWAFGGGAGHLVLGLVVGRLATAFVYAVNVWRFDRAVIARPLEDGELLRTARRFLDFPRFSMPGNLLNESVSDVPTFLITGYYGAAATGLFSMARKALGMPVTLISEAVSQVAHQRIAAAKNAGRPGYLIVLKVFGFLLALIAGPMLAFSIWAPDLFGWIMGPSWEESGRFARALVPMYAMKFAVQPITRAFLVYERQLGGLIWQGSYFLVSIGCLMAGHRILGDPVAATWCYGVAAGAMYAVILALNVRWSGGGIRKLSQRWKGSA
jgi:O-antigen/teichoic acid export membrane protein